MTMPTYPADVLERAAKVGGVFAAPVRWFGHASDYVGGYFFAVSENRRLRRELAELQPWRDQAIAQGMIAGPSWGLDYDAKLQPVAVVAVLEEAYRASARNEVEKSKKKAGK